MKENKKKVSKRTIMVRSFCIILAALMVLGMVTYALMVILHTARCTVDTIHMGRDAFFST